jgi:hypothetical protein
MVDGTEVNKQIYSIVTILTERLFSHLHIINPREALRIGLKAKSANIYLDYQLWQLFSEYATEMKLENPINRPQLLGSNNTMSIELKRAFVESSNMADTFVSAGTLSRGAVRMQFPTGLNLPPGIQPQIQVAFQIDFEGWKIIR